MFVVQNSVADVEINIAAFEQQPSLTQKIKALITVQIGLYRGLSG